MPFLTMSRPLSPAKAEAPMPPIAPAIAVVLKPVAAAALATRLVPPVKKARPTPTASLPSGLLTSFLAPFLIFLQALLKPNSGSPVAGLIVPEPPIRLSIAAS